MWSLDVYQVIDGTDDWPLVETITADTPEECEEIYSEKYDNDLYHCANPYKTFAGRN